MPVDGSHEVPMSYENRMAAYVDAEFTEGFLLSEENLLRIDEIIRRRLPDLGDKGLVYRVYRDDDTTFRYHKPQQVVSEENARRNAVNALEAEVESDPFVLLISFSRNSGTRLRLRSEDRDSAFLMSSELKEYLRGEVLRLGGRRLTKILTSRLAFPLLSIFGMFAAIAVFAASLERPDQKAALASASAIDKLNYLIRIRSDSDQIDRLPYVFFGPFLLSFLVVGFAVILSKLLPTNIFYWGKEKERYDRLKKFRDKIFWGVGIALLVGLASTAIFELLSS